MTRLALVLVAAARARAAGRSGPLRRRRGDRRPTCPRCASRSPMPRAWRRSRRSSSSGASPPPGCATCRARSTSSGSARAARPTSRTTCSPSSSGTSRSTGRSTSGRRRRRLPAVRVAVIDSGIDADHPDFAGGKIADAKTFVGGSARVDEEGHGTFVAGLIAAGVNNTVGIAGRRLLRRAPRREGRRRQRPDRRRGRGEGDQVGGRAAGARVINMSLGGFRDPRDPDLDAFSPLEAQAAIGWAHGRGVRSSWPRSEQHRRAAAAVAVRELSGGAAARARRQRPRPRRFRPRLLAPGQDLQRQAAPGVGILSTFPRPHRRGEGVPGAGLLELRVRRLPQGPGHLLRGAAGERGRRRPARGPAEPAAGAGGRAAHAHRAKTSTAPRAAGCAPLQRDALTGWGRLDVNAALKQLLSADPPRDRLEPNDDAGAAAAALGPAGSGSTRRSTSGTTRTTSTRSGSSGGQRLFISLRRARAGRMRT